MTIVLSTQYPGKADAPSAGYPQGSFKNVTAPGAGDGTPWEKVWVNDWAGFFQRLISEASITPSGSPDTILAGDHWDALISRFQQGIPAVDSGTAGEHAVVSALGADPAALYNGLTLQYAVNTLNTGAVDINYATIGAKDLTLPGGTELSGGELNAGQYITVRYLSSPDRFEIVSRLESLTLTMEDGIELSNNTVDAAKDIDFSPGSVCDSTKNTIIKLPAIMVKQLDAAWAVGTNAGGLFTGSIAADTIYYCFTIQKDTDGSADCGFDVSPIAANRPAGYTKFRYRGSFLTDSTPDILPFVQQGDEFRYLLSILDEDNTTQSTTAVNYNISIPDAITVQAIVTVSGQRTTPFSGFYAQDKALTEYSPNNGLSGAGKIGHVGIEASASSPGVTGNLYIRSTDGQIVVKASSALGRFKIVTHGWVDRRGKE